MACEQEDQVDYDYEDEDEDDDVSDGDDYEMESGWELAARGVRLALNNRVEEAERLLRGRAEVGGMDPDGGRLQAQAGLSFLTFMVGLCFFGFLII